MPRSVLALAPLLALIVVTGSTAGLVAGRTPAGSSISGPGAIATDAVAVPVDAATHALRASTPISLTLTLKNPRGAALDEFLAQVEDPASPEYHHFLTSSEYLSRFAPPPSEVSAVVGSLRSDGAQNLTVAPDRSFVMGVLSAGEVESLLGVRLIEFGQSGSLAEYTSVGAVSLPTSLAGDIDGVGGLSDEATVTLVAQQRPVESGVQPVVLSGGEFAHDNLTDQDWFLGSDYTQLYHVTDLFPGTGSVANATFPGSVAIATLLVSAYNQSAGGDGNLPPFDPNVVHSYLNSTLGPGWPVSNATGVPVPIDGVLPPLPGSFGNVNDSTPYETENSLDLEMAGSLAPGAALYNFYYGASLLTGSTTNGDAADYFAMALAEALTYAYSPQHLTAVSCSFGLPDLDDTAWDAELLTAASLGVTVVAASGDQGNAPDSLTGRPDGQWPVWPASDAMDLAGALAAGGVSFDATGTPNAYFNGSSLNISYDPDVGQLEDVTAWYDTTSGPGYYAGSEGGISTVYAEPDWQFHSAAEPAIVNATVREGASSLGRAEPDLAMPANDTIATVAANSSGGIFFDVLEGTSVASPVLAGVLADIVAVENNGTTSGWTSLGFIDPLIYQFGSYFATHPGAASDPYLDVTSGGNYVFSAGPGWDAVTGWGELEAPAMLAALHNSTLLDYNYTGPTPTLPIPHSSPSGSIPWTVIFAIFGVGVTVAIVLVVFAARPGRPRSAPPTVPWGAQGGGALVPGAPGTLPGATFLCPYCGAIRPAEPVRCPVCGAY